MTSTLRSLTAPLLEILADSLDFAVRLLSPLLPGLQGGALAYWAEQPLDRFETITHPRAYILRGLGFELVLDRQRPR